MALENGQNMLHLCNHPVPCCFLWYLLYEQTNRKQFVFCCLLFENGKYTDRQRETSELKII